MDSLISSFAYMAVTPAMTRLDSYIYPVSEEAEILGYWGAEQLAGRIVSFTALRVSEVRSCDRLMPTRTYTTIPPSAASTAVILKVKITVTRLIAP
ncbi:MAG: hypothetical protein HY860_05000 [Chlamydiales bacterium]|nr:hypothetical protein [Chlamydiales bacterium]